MEVDLVSDIERAGIENRLVGVTDDRAASDAPRLVTNYAIAVLASRIGAITIAVHPRA